MHEECCQVRIVIDAAPLMVRMYHSGSGIIFGMIVPKSKIQENLGQHCSQQIVAPMHGSSKSRLIPFNWHCSVSPCACVHANAGM